MESMQSWKAMSKVGTPTVIAPCTEQSAASHSITLNKPLFINYISRDYGFEGWSVDGLRQIVQRLNK